MNDTAIVITVLGALGAVFFAFASRLSEGLVRTRAQRLPTRLALRMEEEWLGELNAITSRLDKLAFAIALTLTRRQAFAAPGEDSMTEIHSRPTGGLTAFNGRKTLLILPTLVFAIAGYGASFLLPVRYESESLILVRPRDIPSSLVVDLIAGSVEERLKSIEQTVMSRTNLVSIVREFGDQLPELRQLNMDEKVSKLKSQIAITFQGGERQVEAGKEPINFFRIRYQNQNPKLAQTIATKLTLLFIEKDNATRENQIAGTRDFLQRRLDAIGERLTEKGDELARARAAQEPKAARLLALDYELLVSTYRSVFAKLEDAEMTAVLESEQRGGQFQVVDPANLPREPVGPNRLGFAGLGALAGLVLGGMTLLSLNRRQRRALA